MVNNFSLMKTYIKYINQNNMWSSYTSSDKHCQSFIKPWSPRED